MTVQEKSIGFKRSRLRALIAASALGLLVGFGGVAPVYAQDDKPEKAEKSERAEKKGPMVMGDDTFDPNQPIKADFVINVSVAGEPDPSGNYAVDQSGNVAIKYAGIMTPVNIKGLTPMQAADAIAKFLKTYVKNPQVTVSIVSVPRPIVFVVGAVKNTGPIIITQDTTLVDILSKAEWSENADLSQVRITRKEIVDNQEKMTATTYRFDRYIKVGAGEVPDEKENPVLKDKDRIFVPFKSLPGNGVVSVGGEVTKPGQSVPLRTSPPMTVRELINLVGGTTPAANRKAVSIRRPTVDRPLIIDLDKAEQGDLVNNIELRPDDAVYVEKLENNAYINLNGAFIKPGKFVYDKRTTLSQAVMEGGGFQPNARVWEGKIFRHPDNDPKNTRVIAFNFNAIQKGQAADIELQPGDSIWVPTGQPSAQLQWNVWNVLSLIGQGAFVYGLVSGNAVGFGGPVPLR
jgi:protein involved in polysaccharide export with SLBB domain